MKRDWWEEWIEGTDVNVGVVKLMKPPLQSRLLSSWRLAVATVIFRFLGAAHFADWIEDGKMARFLWKFEKEYDYVCVYEYQCSDYSLMSYDGV